MDQDAIVCRFLDDEVAYSSIEIVHSFEMAKFIDDKGDDAVGSIVVIY